MNTHNVNVKTATKKSTERWVKRPVLSADLLPLRGLDVRIAFGKAKVMRVIDADKAAIEEDDALWDAEILGYHEYRTGLAKVPAMFTDEPALVGAWLKGWVLSIRNEELDYCPDCNRGTGEPCPFHG